MRVIHDRTWTQRGISFLWDSRVLFEVIEPSEARSIRQFFEIASSWPGDLPSGGGNTLVVGGLDACLDVLSPGDAEKWLENRIRPALLAFQDEYEQQAGLIFWLPTGRNRVSMKSATGEYLWRCAPPFSKEELPLGRILWSGAEGDVGRIMNPEGNAPHDVDGPSWIGLHHPRIS